MSEKRSDILTLKKVRLSFPKIFKKAKTSEDGPEKYTLAGLMDPNTPEGKENIAAVKAMQTRLAKATWKDNWEKVLKAMEWDRRLLRPGDRATNSEGDVYTGYEGMYFVTASNTRNIKVRNRDKSPAGKNDAEKFYGGCYVDLVLSCYTVTDRKKGGNGLFATIEIVRWRADGEAFGAAPVDEDDYLDDLDDLDEDDDLDDSGSDDDDDDDMI